MGLDLVTTDDPGAIRSFTRAVLRDLKALERLVDEGAIESGVRRLGAEQELFLVGKVGRPAPVAERVLERLGKPFTTELALFNLEANLEPRLLQDDGLTWLEARLNELVGRARVEAAKEGAEVVLTGILPTLLQSDLTLENITPRQRYFALNEALCKQRAGPAYRLRIEGTDELLLEHESVMLEACNTSFQAHLQVSAEEFPVFYNAAQAVLAPVLAAAVNSPILFGKRLWEETRIALFQQSLDTRSATLHMREVAPRVRFGERWVRSSVAELYQEDLARFPMLLAMQVEENPFDVLNEGGVPRLQALQLYNSTIYRWNRACYGITDGRPHLRIECRALPSGPSVIDEVANTAFWVGAVLGVVEAYGNIGRTMEFDDARTNFLTAARIGLKAAFVWQAHTPVSAPRLIRDTLLPLARDGLLQAGVESAVVDRYLHVIEERVDSGQNGATWTIRSLSALKEQGTLTERLAAVTAASIRLQKEGEPVHRWALAELREAGGWREHYLRVEQYMTTRLVTIRADEPVDLVAFLMDRGEIRHVLVEDHDHRLVGVISYRSILRLAAEVGLGEAFGERPARDIMEASPLTVAPETTTLEAIRLLREHRITCLPVVKNGKLVGIVTERDILPIAYGLLETRLEEDTNE
jgi:CBS domain-containing protein